MWSARELMPCLANSPGAAVDKLLGRLEELGVHSFHALAGQGTGVLAALPAHPAKLRIFGGVVLVRRPAVQYTPRPKLLLERRILHAGVVELLRLFFGVEMVKVAVELVEAVHSRQELVTVPEVILAELSRRVAERLQHLGQGRVFFLQAER
jgi:hypothetical protein